MDEDFKVLFGYHWSWHKVTILLYSNYFCLVLLLESLTSEDQMASGQRRRKALQGRLSPFFIYRQHFFSDSTNSEATVNSFEEVKATLTHDALRILEENGHIAYLISQNVDGIHSRFSFPLDRLAEVHGNVFQKRCNKCRR